MKKALPILCGVLAAVVVIIAAVAIIANAGSPVEKAFDAGKNSISNLVKNADVIKFLQGGSIELSGNAEEITENMLGTPVDVDALAKIYFNLPEYKIALEAKASMGKTELVDAAAYISRDAIAVTSDSFLKGNTYGIDITKFEKNFPDSEFAEDGEYELGIDAEELTAYLELAKEAEKTMPKATSAALADLEKIIIKAIEKNAEVSKASGKLDVGTKTVKTTDVTISVKDEAIGDLVIAILEGVKKSSKIEAFVEEYVELASSLEQMEDMVETLEEYQDYIDEAIETIEDSKEDIEGVEIELIVSISKSAKEIVGIQVKGEIEDYDEEISVDVVCGPTWSALEEISVKVDNGYEEIKASYEVKTNDKKSFDAKIFVGSDSEDVLSASIKWDKKEGDLKVSADISGDEFVLKANMNNSSKAAVIALSSVEADGEKVKLDGFTLTVNYSDKMPEISKFDDVLTMDADQLEEIVELVEESVGELESELEDIIMDMLM